MTRQEWNELKIGDICELTRGEATGRRGRVVYISEDTACLESLNGERFIHQQTSRTLTLQNWRNIIIIKD